MSGGDMSDSMAGTRGAVRPLVLCDFDGVLNAVRRGETTMPESFGDWRRARIDDFLIVWSPSAARRLDALDAEVVWLTSWRSRANSLLCPLLGWPERRVLEIPTAGENDTFWWKANAARRLLESEQRPVVWIDDDLAEAINAGEVPFLDDLAVPFLLVTPRKSEGLDEEQLARVEQFVARRGDAPSTAPLVPFAPLVERANQSDAPGIATLMSETLPVPHSVSSIRADLSRHDHHCVVVRDRGTVVGFAALDGDGSGARLHLAVAPAHRRQGLGRALVAHAAAVARSAGATRLVVFVGSGLEVAPSFLSALGFSHRFHELLEMKLYRFSLELDDEPEAISAAGAPGLGRPPLAG